MTRKLFGTDGIRGTANTDPMTAETALKVAMAAALQLRRGDHKHKVVIGKDTRLSGYMLEQALTSGFLSMGMDVFLVGPMPTPAVAMLTRSMRCDLGVMISASHNPYMDNGIKLFGSDGFKLSDRVEEEIEQRVAKPFADDLSPADKLGRATRIDDAMGRYIEFVKSSFPKGLRLEGLKIVIDCAHGAAYKVAPRVLWELGADVVPIAVEPNGKNINKNCGATDVAALQETVVQHGADIGIALDGDADRVMICDENGHVVDGDQIMALIAQSWQASDRLRGKGVVATVMSNLGLERYLKDIGLDLSRTPVGDRHVVEHMMGGGFNVGGEQSGHIILGDYNTTGDGLIAALQVLAVLQQTDRKASDACRVFAPVPQVLQNVRFATPGLLETADVTAVLKEAENKMQGQGRLLVRKSGTEPLIRVMAEGDDKALIETLVADVCADIERLDKSPAKAATA